MFQQAKLLEYDLAVACSPTGQFRDVFSGDAQFPLLSLADWLRVDLTAAGQAVAGTAADEEELAGRLLLAGVLLAMRSHLLESVADPFSSYEERHAALAQFCTERALLELAAVVPPESAFWRAQQSISLADLEARAAPRLQLADPEAAQAQPRWSAPARQLTLAALHVVGRPELAPDISQLVDRLALAFAIRAEIETMHRDALNGRPSYPIAFVARAAGIPLSPPPEATLVLGALVATGSLPLLLRQAEELLAAARRSAGELGLSTLAGFLDEAQPHFANRTARAMPRPLTSEPGARPSGEAAGDAGARSAVGAPLLRIAEPAPSRAIAMAGRFLLADPELRESWEVHREGMFGADEVVARFPAGLILEILLGAGHDVRPAVGRFLEQAAASRFRYYDHRWCDPDSDTLGVYLRLRAKTGAPAVHAEALAETLTCLAEDVARQGFVPVWISACTPPEAGRPAVLALGEHCGTVAANLLLGLCVAGEAEQAETLRTGAGHLLARIGQVGLAANVDYPPLYALGAFFRLLGALERTAGTVSAAAWQGARTRLESELLHRGRARRLGAQDAALSILACHAAERAELIADEWTASILKHQRPDGGWPAEPFAAVPNRGGWVSWYASSLLTSALCYEALLAQQHV